MDATIADLIASLDRAGDTWPDAIRRDHDAVSDAVDAALTASGIDLDNDSYATIGPAWSNAYDELAPQTGAGLAGLQILHEGDRHIRDLVMSERVRDETGPVRLYRHEVRGWQVLGWSDAARARQLYRPATAADLAEIQAEVRGPGDDA